MTTKPTPTASFFREPLLKALGILSQGSTEPVEMKEALLEVYDATGHRELDWGVDGYNIPHTRLWIQQAFHKILCKQGLAQKGSRGKWCLTEDGLSSLKAFNLPIPQPEEASMVRVEEQDPDPVSWRNPVGTDSYSKDRYICALAAQATPCFGSHSPRSTVCTGCSLQVSCAQQFSVLLAQEASKLRDLEIMLWNTHTDALLPEEKRDPLAQILDAIKSKPPEEEEVVDMASLPSEGLCAFCKEKIVRGSPAKIVVGKGAFHITCFDLRGL